MYSARRGLGFGRCGVTKTVHHGAREQHARARAVAPQLFDRYREGLQGALRSAVPSADPRYSPLRYHLGWEAAGGAPVTDASVQGKALRPTLCLFACEALGGDWRDALPAAAALELIHNFSLIHDDIQDGDTERRHRPTVWSIWGQPRALMAGNSMRALAHLSLDLMPSPGVSGRASELLTRRYLQMIEGQYLDLTFEGRLDVSVDDYIHMVSCKTGALIQCPMELGALVAGTGQASIDAFGRCGLLLGIAFQIKDDVLGIWGDTAATGKAAGNDIWRRKKSLPIVYAFQQASPGSAEALRRIYQAREVGPSEVEEVMGVLEEVGAEDYCLAQARERAALSLQSVRGLPLSEWAASNLQSMVEFLVERDY